MEATNEQIDRNDLLASTRAIFVRTFIDALESVIKQSAENLFTKADRSPSYQVQKRMLEGRGVLEKKSFDIKAQMKKAMEKLLHRSFQTTYSNYRPSFSNSILEGPISLIDTSAFEDELRFNNITDRFRNEAGEQLRDLNIRIALLFEQDNIRERENPFRPYLFSRAIAMAVENVDAPPELHVTLADQLAEDFTSQVPSIYAAVNDHLAENGIAAQLMLKPKRSPEPRRTQDFDDDDDEFEDNIPAAPARRSLAARQASQQQAPGSTAGQAGVGHAQQAGSMTRSGAYPAAGQIPQNQPQNYPAPAHGPAYMGGGAPQQSGRQQNGRQQQAEPQVSPVERLFSSVRALASRPFRGVKPGSSEGAGEAQADAGFVQGDAGQPGGPGGAANDAGGVGSQHADFNDGAGGPQGAAPGHGAAGGNHGAGGQGSGGAQGNAGNGSDARYAQESGSDGTGHAGGTNRGFADDGRQPIDQTSVGIGMSGAGTFVIPAEDAAVTARPGTAGGHGGAGSAHGNAGSGAGAGDSHAGGAAASHDAGSGSGSGTGRQGASGNGTSGTSGTNDAGSASGGTNSGRGAAAGGGPGSGGAPSGNQAQGGGAGTSGAETGPGGFADDAPGTEDGAPGQPKLSNQSRPSWISGKKAVGGVLRRFFAGDSAPDDFDDFEDTADGEAAPVRAAPGLLAGTVQRLIRHSTPETTDMYSASGEIRNLIMERRSGLNEVASSLKEQMTIDIVSMLFEFILRDTQVPAEVRAQLGRLQFLVLKIALRDESLLTTKAHPARMLVNRIGSISLGLKQVDPSGVAVTEEICRIVEAILADETENPNLFLKMLDDLDTFIARELLTQEKGVSSAVEAVEHAENRTLRLAHTSAQVSEALQGLNINEHLREFLENDWARAIEYAERNNPAITAEYRALIPDLLWSVLPKVNEEDRQKLLALLPPILKTIHGGMEPIGWPSANKQTLMDWLFDAHTLVLRGNSAGPPPITFSAIHSHFKKFVDNPESVQPTAPGHVTPLNRKGYLEEAMRELDARINMLDHFFDDDPELQAELQAQEDEEAADGASEDEKPFDIAERLRVGVAIEVNLGGKPSTGRLNWINQNASNMVLTLNDQAEPSMISARMFQRLLKNDRVRFLEDEPIFERAVESLLSAADA